MIVISGFLDSYFYIYEDIFWKSSGHLDVAWLLAPWSDNDIVWRRALCLYTFGLSMHYFIWLKAIPENVYNNKTPVSFKKSFNSIYNSYGAILTYSFLSLSIIGIIIWGIWYEIGSYLYFTISNMHVWTELTMLFASFSIFGFSKKQLR
tara:strand:- start:154393 stop:154839 length:447 start_codon:yes stop_codon:yes gene_type:complete